jgi:hypothetical protein
MTAEKPSSLTAQALLLLNRLERISADSPWAHMASGIRASLARNISEPNPDIETIRTLISRGYSILEKAAAEIPED